MPLILDSPPSSPDPLPTTQAAELDQTTATATATNGIKKESTREAAAEKRRLEQHDADVVIIGAGIVGCALAVALAKQGRSVILLEKSLKEPDRIVGELLQPGGVEALRKLGLRDCLDDIDAIVTRGYEVRYHGEPVEISYPVSDETRKRPEGRSFHHGRFVQKLRTAAMKSRNVSVFETKATELVRNGYNGQVLGVQCVTKGEKDYFFGHLTICADGYSSIFRRAHHPHAPAVRSKFWGLELIDAKLPRQQYGHVILSDGPPILLYQIGSRETRALVDVPENLPSAKLENGGIKGHLTNVVLPTLPECVQPSFREAVERGGLRSMPNSFLPPATNKTPGMLIIGDAMNMRHPLTGGGMTVAFNDALLLAELLRPERVPHFDDTKLVLRQLGQFHWRRKSGSSVINILAMALYSLFAANDPSLRTLQLGCFRYFKLGGNCVDQPVSLLGGINRQPLVLVYHFFAVAVLAMWTFIVEGGRARATPVRFVTSAAVLWKACVVIFPYIFSELAV